MQKTLAQFHTARYDADIQSVTLIAKSYQKDNPDMSWGECIRLAEKHITVR